MQTGIPLSAILGFALICSPTASAHDYWDLASDQDDTIFTDNELTHGVSQQHDLENSASTTDEDWYIAISYAHSSYEAVIDSASGDLDLGPSSLERLDTLGTTVLQPSENTNGVNGPGYSRALRWEHTGSGFVTHKLRVQSSCSVLPSNCGPEDQYRIRFHETTVSIPRFNNSSGQVTVLIIQNSTDWNRPIAGTAYFRSTAGTVAGSHTFSLAPGEALVLNTSTVPGVAGSSGTITVAHDGGYGNLAMKAVALDPATGFSFDTPGSYKPH